MKLARLMASMAAVGLTAPEMERKISPRYQYVKEDIKTWGINRPKAKAARKARRIERKNRK